MNGKFFSHGRSPGDPTEGGGEVRLERQQAIVMEALSASPGAAVGYEELREAGVEFPASVVSELELAGFPIERCYEHDGRAHLAVGVRLDTARALYVPPPASAGGAEERDVAARGLPAVRWPSAWPRLLHDGAYTRWLAAWGLVGVATTIVVLGAVGLASGGRGGPRPGGAHRRSARVTVSDSSVHRANTAARASHPAVRTPVSPVLAGQLEAQGHDLVEAGEYEQAIGVLRRALAATGENVGECVDPTTEACLTYAYALYDLGRALRLNGSPGQAVGVLEHRLEIENQQPIVAEELASAREQLG